MKILAKDIEAFIKKIPNNIRAILLYGPDSGLISIRKKIIETSFSSADSFRYDEIKNNSAIILDSFYSIKLFGEDLSREKLIIIESTSSSITEAMTKVITEGNYKGLLLFCAGDLGADSGLRKYFEKHQNAASVPCYIDDQVGIVKIIEQQFKLRNITYKPGLPQLLVHYIPFGNRESILNEIEKISLFMGEKKSISIDDFEIYLDAQGEVNFDKLCYQISLKQNKNIESLLIKLQNEGHNLISISRMVIRHFNRLYQVKSLINQGKSEKMALDSLVPNVFFKYQNDFSKSVNMWDENQLMCFLKKINEVELFSKQDPVVASLVFRKLITQFI